MGAITMYYAVFVYLSLVEEIAIKSSNASYANVSALRDGALFCDMGQDLTVDGT